MSAFWDVAAIMPNLKSVQFLAKCCNLNYDDKLVYHAADYRLFDIAEWLLRKIPMRAGKPCNVHSLNNINFRGLDVAY